MVLRNTIGKVLLQAFDDESYRVSKGDQRPESPDPDQEPDIEERDRCQPKRELTMARTLIRIISTWTLITMRNG